ncbi:MAG: gamma-glutamylcyclotransferase family protein [Actinomycetota bacterium]
MTRPLFSYGTLRQPEVQRALFGREVATTDDTLLGFRLDYVTITDASVIAKSGTDRHPILCKGGAEDSVVGAYLDLSPAEIDIADKYEVDDYVRIHVILMSGVSAWVYVAAEVANVFTSIPPDLGDEEVMKGAWN